MFIEPRVKDILGTLELSASMSTIKENISQPSTPSRLPIGSLLKGSHSSTIDSDMHVPSPKATPPISSKANPITPQSISTEAEQVVALMRANIATMLERGDSVAKLSEKSEQLQAQAYRFRVQAQRTERNLWWRNMRMNIAIAILSMIAIGIVVSVLVRGSSTSTTSNSIQKSLSQEPFPVFNNTPNGLPHEQQMNTNANSGGLPSSQANMIPPKSLDLKIA